MQTLSDAWDYLEEQLAVLVIQNRMQLNAAIFLVCENNMSFPVEAMMLATVSFVTHMEATDTGNRKARSKLSLERHKTAVALAADISALNLDTATCGDLIDFWELSGDKMFTV